MVPKSSTRHHESTHRILVWVNDIDRGVFLQSLVGVIRVRQAEGCLAGNHQPFHFAVRAGDANVVILELLKESIGLLITPGSKQGSSVHGGSPKQGVGQGCLPFPSRVCQVADRLWRFAAAETIPIHEQDSRPCGEPSQFVAHSWVLAASTPEVEMGEEGDGVEVVGWAPHLCNETPAN